MKILRNPLKKLIAKQLAGNIPDSIIIVGLIIGSDTQSLYGSALCYCSRTRRYVSMIDGVIQSVDQSDAKNAVREIGN